MTSFPNPLYKNFNLKNIETLTKIGIKVDDYYPKSLRSLDERHIKEHTENDETF
jgi:hypothetical protein